MASDEHRQHPKTRLSLGFELEAGNHSILLWIITEEASEVLNTYLDSQLETWDPYDRIPALLVGVGCSRSATFFGMRLA